MTILVVDDHPANRELMEFLLRNYGYQVRTVVDAESALIAISAKLPQLILMDVQLPGMDGLELTRKLKADNATRDICIVAVTSYAMSDDHDRAIAAGCDGYIAKPIPIDTFPTLIAEFLGKK